MTSPTFNVEFAPQYDVPEIIGRKLRRIVAANPGPMTFRGTNTYLVGEGVVTIVDPGPEDAKHTAAILAATQGETIERIILTHSHRDHAGGVAALAEGRPVVAHVGRGRATGDATGSESPVPGLVAAPIADGEIFAADGMQLEAVATPGHASDHMCLALLGTPVLFSGDHVMGWSTTVVSPPDGSMADYMRSLERLLTRPERRYLPGHGAPIEAGPEQVRGLRTHRRMREAAIIERIGKGDNTVAQLVAALYRGLDPKLVGAASRSVLAHLEDLVARGIIATDGAVTAAAEYRPAI